MQTVRNTYYSFPVQLVLLHLRRNLFLSFSFILPILIVTKNFGVHFGLVYLFLDPEYLSRVSFWSFFIVGLGFGAFVLAWNITSYILHSHRFPFLATFERPFLRYCLNNSVIPLSFALIYFICLVNFQVFYELKEWYVILVYFLGFCFGGAIMILLAMSKSLNTSFDAEKDKASEDNKMAPTRKSLLRPWRFSNKGIMQRQIRVDYFFIHPLKVRRVRDVSHYDHEKLLTVFKQHHRNALILELIGLELIILLGFLMDYKLFRVPASASIMLLLAILVAPIGAFTYYLKSWGTSVFLLLLFFFSLMMQFNFFNHENSAFGLNYGAKKPAYSLNSIVAAANPTIYGHDKQLGLQMLENWKNKLNPTHNPDYKPTMVLINSSGGGLRATVWSFYMMQQMDSLTHSQFFNHTAIMSGASGGTLGQAYFRELYLRKKTNDSINLHAGKYLTKVSKDMLNGLAFSLVVNDLLIPWQRFRQGNYLYRKDRGYMWEKELNDNTNNILNKPISAYTEPELNATIPMLVFTPTIIDDARRLNISALPVAYLDRPSQSIDSTSELKVDGIDLINFFKGQDPGDLSFTTAIRMNATFPYIMPNVFLPTVPAIQTMDAGLRDNYGMETSMRFLETFKDWINANVGNVVIVQIRDMKKNPEPIVTKHPSLITKLADPINSIYVNWSDYQDFHFDNVVNTSGSWLNNKLQVLTFDYIPSELNQAASMSWHLTTRETWDVISAFNNPQNQQELAKLMKLLH